MGADDLAAALDQWDMGQQGFKSGAVAYNRPSREHGTRRHRRILTLACSSREPSRPQVAQGREHHSDLALAHVGKSGIMGQFV